MPTSQFRFLGGPRKSRGLAWIVSAGNPWCPRVAAGTMAVVALLMSAPGCQKEAAPITSQTSKYEVGDTSSSAAAPVPAPASDRASANASAGPGARRSAAPPGTSSPADGRPATKFPPSEASSSSASSAAPASPQPTDPQPAASSASAEGDSAAPPIKPPVVSRAQLDNLEPPDGPPEAIWAFIEALDKRAPRGRTRQEMIEDIQATIAARIAAGNRLFSHPQAQPKMRQDAADVVLSSWNYLSELGVPNVLPNVRAFCKKMSEDKDEEIAQSGRLLMFSLELGDLLDDKNGDADKFLQTALDLLQNEKKTEALFQHTRNAALTLFENEHGAQGRKLADAVTKAFADSEDPLLARQVAMFVEEARFGELEMNKKIGAFAQGEPNSLQPLVDATLQLLAQPNLGMTTLQQTSFIADALERLQQVEQAKMLYQRIGEAFKDAQDEQLRAAVQETVDYADRRLNLISRPLELTGKLFDGSDFRAADYQGKVVLVTFWSAENLQYLQLELPAIKRLYDIYKSQGFEVVGVNVDKERALVERFMAFQPLPWKTIMDGSDGKGALMEQCGLRTVPFNLLLDQKGVVVAMHVDSRTLPEKLLNLFGQGEKPAPAGPAPEAPENNSGAATRSRPSSRFTDLASVRDEETFLVSTEGAEEDSPETEPAKDGQRQGATSDAVDAQDDNPYLAREDLGRAELVEFLLKMEEKPLSIRRRPGFDEALLDAADRILRQGRDDMAAVVALETTFRTLHRWACDERAGAQEKLESLLAETRNDTRPRIRQEVEFLELETALVHVDQLPVEEVPALLDRVVAYLKEHKPNARHLRFASQAIHAVNRIDVEKREPYFQALGKLFAAGTDRQLASYGRKVADAGETSASDVIGQSLELHGLTTLGVEFDGSRYEGKVVLVDFWATWCGPCRRETPLIKALKEKYAARGFEVIGVNLDKDQEAVAKYLEEQSIPWENIVEDGAKEAARRYGVSAIPTLLLVDRSGKIVAAVHHSGELAAKLEELLPPQQKD